MITDRTRAVVERLEYLPFGEVRVNTGSVNVPYKFTGKILDAETGLNYFGARYYNAAIGRWISPDPTVPHPENLQSLNRYSYVLNRPLTLVDPDGYAEQQASQATAANRQNGSPTGGFNVVAQVNRYGIGKTLDKVKGRGKGGFSAWHGVVDVLLKGSHVAQKMVHHVKTADVKNQGEAKTGPAPGPDPGKMRWIASGGYWSGGAGNGGMFGPHGEVIPGSGAPLPIQLPAPSPQPGIETKGKPSESGEKETPDTNPEKFKPVRGRPGKQNIETGEIFERDKFHKDHYEVYRNLKNYENGRRSGSTWSDGRPKDSF